MQHDDASSPCLGTLTTIDSILFLHFTQHQFLYFVERLGKVMLIYFIGSPHQQHQQPCKQCPNSQCPGKQLFSFRSIRINQGNSLVRLSRWLESQKLSKVTYSLKSRPESAPPQRNTLDSFVTKAKKPVISNIL